MNSPHGSAPENRIPTTRRSTKTNIVSNFNKKLTNNKLGGDDSQKKL
jgi:hypothetical protein